MRFFENYNSHDVVREPNERKHTREKPWTPRTFPRVSSYYTSEPGVCRALLSRCVPLETCIPYVNRESLSGRTFGTKLASGSCGSILYSLLRVHTKYSTWHDPSVSPMPKTSIRKFLKCSFGSSLRFVGALLDIAEMNRPDVFLSERGLWNLTLASAIELITRDRNETERAPDTWNGTERGHRARQVDDASGMTLFSWLSPPLGP